MTRARDAGLDLRASLHLAYNKVLDLIGPAGLAFKRPMNEDAAAAPAAAAVPVEEPPLRTS